MKRRSVIFAILVLAAGAAYLVWNGIAHPHGERTAKCAGNSIAAVAVRPIIDARTREEIPDEIASRGTLIVQDGTYADTTPLLMGAAPNRPGTYTIVVRLSGYREWRRSRVHVPRRPCTVHTAIVRAVLQRAPESGWESSAP
jgi:hypothetical protein